MVLWKYKGLRFEQLFVLLLTGTARFVYSFHAWFGAGYTLTTFHWANIYEIVGREAMQGQLFDPVATVGCFVAVGILLLGVWVFCQGEWKLTQTVDETSRRCICQKKWGRDPDVAGASSASVLWTGGRVFSALYGSGLRLSVLCTGSDSGVGGAERIFLAAALQIVTFAGYQECVNGESMMPM